MTWGDMGRHGVTWRGMERPSWRIRANSSGIRGIPPILWKTAFIIEWPSSWTEHHHEMTFIMEWDAERQGGNVTEKHFLEIILNKQN